MFSYFFLSSTDGKWKRLLEISNVTDSSSGRCILFHEGQSWIAYHFVLIKCVPIRENQPFCLFFSFLLATFPLILSTKKRWNHSKVKNLSGRKYKSVNRSLFSLLYGYTESLCPSKIHTLKPNPQRDSIWKQDALWIRLVYL